MIRNDGRAIQERIFDWYSWAPMIEHTDEYDYMSVGPGRVIRIGWLRFYCNDGMWMVQTRDRACWPVAWNTRFSLFIRFGLPRGPGYNR
jgi:hypothetical protein